jgi:hypothetical protein
MFMMLRRVNAQHWRLGRSGTCRALNARPSTRQRRKTLRRTEGEFVMKGNETTKHPERQCNPDKKRNYRNKNSNKTKKCNDNKGKEAAK